MNKETTLSSGYNKRHSQIKKSVRVNGPKKLIIMDVTIPEECPICGTQYDQKEHQECPHCEDNEFDPYNVFQDVDKDYL